jgi:hypothetical protein
MMRGRRLRAIRSGAPSRRLPTKSNLETNLAPRSRLEALPCAQDKPALRILHQITKAAQAHVPSVRDFGQELVRDFETGGF